ncbi:MAG: hypothetical protein FWB95_02635 [Treponema sp.]|nr:hypothetical protein [Treponema sp.]
MNTNLTNRHGENPAAANGQQRKFNEPAVITRLKNHFKDRPSWYYSMSIAATWAGVGSLMVGIQMAQNFGIIPFLIWAFGNTMACIVFGIFAPMIPKVREVFRSKPMQYVVGLMCVFQVWLNLNGIHMIFKDTPMTGTFGLALAYLTAAFFIFLLFKNGMIRSIFTDNASWAVVYGVALLLTIGAIIHSQGNMNVLSFGMEPASIKNGLRLCILLIPGPFLYPYFFKILDYNDNNDMGAKKINIRRAFIIGGLLFGAYLTFTFLLAWTNFNPVLNIIKAFLIFIIATSTVSSFLYSIYITFGRKLGLFVNITLVGLWQLLIPMGVLGVWTLMASIRIYIVIGAILFAIAWHLISKRKKKGAADA